MLVGGTLSENGDGAPPIIGPGVLSLLLDGGARSEALRRGGTKPLSELVAGVGRAEGSARLKAYLDSEPFPHFEAHPTRRGFLIRTDADGRRLVGRFAGRVFIAEKNAAVRKVRLPRAKSA